MNKVCPEVKAGKYQCTPGFPFVGFEIWGDVTPFVLQDNTQFRPGPPYAITDAKFKKDLDEVKSLGGDGKTTPSARTDDQTEVALFWLESSPLKWSRIARTVATNKGLNTWESARLLALLNMTLADGYVAMVASKNHYNFWRPVTAIRNADIDGNPATDLDSSWQPIAATPMHPEYPCAHCILSGSVAGVVKAVFGTEEIPEIATTSPTAPGVTHRWTNMTAYTDEVANARIWSPVMRSSSLATPS